MRQSRFVVECWLRGEFGQWFVIEHVQSGQSIQVASVGKAEAWMRARSRPQVVVHLACGGREMTMGYSSFLVRCWSRGNLDRRFVVEHVQSGRSLHVVSLGMAEEWMHARLDEAERAAPPAIEPARVATQE